MAAQQSIAVGARPAARRGGIFKSTRRRFGRDWPIAWLFFLPTALLIFGLIGYPFVRALYLSLFNVVGTRAGAFVGLQNYQNLWRDDFFVRSVWTTVTFTFWSEIFKFTIGLITALLLHNLPRWVGWPCCPTSSRKSSARSPGASSSTHSLADWTTSSSTCCT